MTTRINTGELTPLDRNGIEKFATLVAYVYSEETALHDRGGDVHDLVTQALSDPEMRLVARFLGAVDLERHVWGDRLSGQDDPPIDGFLGRAIDKVIAELTPLAEARDPRFLNFVNVEYGEDREA